MSHPTNKDAVQTTYREMWWDLAEVLFPGRGIVRQADLLAAIQRLTSDQARMKMQQGGVDRTFALLRDIFGHPNVDIVTAAKLTLLQGTSERESLRLQMSELLELASFREAVRDCVGESAKGKTSEGILEVLCNGLHKIRKDVDWLEEKLKERTTSWQIAIKAFEVVCEERDLLRKHNKEISDSLEVAVRDRDLFFSKYMEKTLPKEEATDVQIK